MCDLSDWLLINNSCFEDQLASGHCHMIEYYVSEVYHQRLKENYSKQTTTKKKTSRYSFTRRIGLNLQEHTIHKILSFSFFCKITLLLLGLGPSVSCLFNIHGIILLPSGKFSMTGA